MKLSIIIPTRERAETLKHTIKTALNQGLESYEVIVSDNASKDDTKIITQSFKDSRIVYINTEERLSMTDNWEFAFNHARGEYIIYIGDDDAITINGIDYLMKMIDRYQADSYKWKTSTYQWPIDDRPASLLYEAPKSSINKELDLKLLAYNCMKDGGWRYYEIPGVYHAAVSKKVLDKIKAKTGRLFHTTQPDLFTALSVPVYASRAISLSKPVTIQGRSAKSNGGSGLAKDGEKNVKQYKDEFGTYDVHKTLIPEITFDGSWFFDAFLVAKDLAPDFYSKIKFNYSAMWAFIIRIGFVNHLTVLKNIKKIKSKHKFSFRTFYKYLFIHKTLKTRRLLIDKMVSAKETNTASSNIYDYALECKINS